MSNIDSRIVDMQFNNRQFESGIQTSIKSLDQLKNGLKLDESARSLSNLNRVGNAFSLSGIASGIESLNSRFSTLGIIGVTALQNITNSAINAGRSLISSLTIDPIKTGFNEYETKMNSIQTIMTNTASKGTTMADVTATLDELNTYADKTIYNFAEMTRNIGTFTAAGIDLKTSSQSIKGIANLAAGSGSNAQQASTAMYQLSQAMAAGTVKLMDWNSVVNAGMGGELFQKALEKTAVELGKGRDMSVSFKESLETGWITTDVMTKTLQKFADDPALMKAATQVKTLTQMIDTMKESVQSGWAQTWEILIGNKDEAATVFTAINDAFGGMIGASAEARNSMLNFWKANHGRDMMIQAITNSFNALSYILKPIGDAFREVFPAMTGQRLLEITQKIRDLTDTFKIGAVTLDNIKRTSKGFFALLDIGKQAIVAIGSGLAELIKYILPAGGGFLSITGDIGDFLVALDNTIKTSGIFNVVIGKFGNVVKNIADGVKTSIDTIIKVFKSFSDVDTSGIDSFGERVKARLEPLTILSDLIHGAFSKITNSLKTVSPIFYKLSEIIGKSFSSIQQNIVKSLDNTEFNSLFDIVNGGIFAGILFGLKKFIDSLTSITDTSGGFLGSLKGILDGVKGSLEAYQSSLKANTLLKIAIAMGILAASLVALSLIDSDKLTFALGAMTTMFIELFGSMAVFEKIMGGAGFKSMSNVSTSMILLSVAVLILSKAMTNLSKLDWDGLTKGLIGVGVLFAELALFMKFADSSGIGTFKGLGLIALAAALLILSSAVEKLSKIDIKGLAKGLTAIGIILAELAAFTKLTGDSKNVITTAIGLTILGGAILIFASAIQKMGSLPIEQIGKGLLTMALSLGIMIGALKLMPTNITGQATGLVILSTALLILSSVLIKMGSMGWEQIAKGLITLAGSLTIMTVAMMFMKTGIAGASAMLIMAGALAILTPVLMALGNMSLGEIAKGLIAMAGMFVIFGIAGLTLGPLIPVILGLAGSIALFGLGCLAVGAGVLAFSAGLAALAVSGTAAGAAIVVIVTTIVGLIPVIMRTLAIGVIEFVKVLKDGYPVIFDAFIAIFKGMINTVMTVTPDIIKCISTLLDLLLDTLLKNVPKLVDSGMKIILGILEGVSANILKVTVAAIDVVLQFIKGVMSKLPDIINTAFELIITFINGLADAIDKNYQAIYDAIRNLIRIIIKVIIQAFPEIIGVGEDLIKGLIKGILNMAGALWDGIVGIVNTTIDSVKDLLGIHSPSTVFAEIGKFMIEGMIEGIKNMGKKLLKAGEDIVSGSVDGIKKLLGIHSPSRVFQDEVGAMIAIGMANGINQNASEVTDATSKMGKDAFEMAKEWIDNRKYYQQITLEDELYVWQEIQNQYADGTDQRIKADKEAHRVMKELYAAEYNSYIKNIDEQKYYQQITLEDELKVWQQMQSKYAEGTEERIKADREVYRLSKELHSAEYSSYIKNIEDRKYYNKMSLQEELDAWKEIQSKYREGTEERIKADKEVYRLEKDLRKDNFDKEIKSIDDRKYYNNLSLKEELDAWEKIQSKYAEGTDERVKADREVYRIKKEISSKINELENNYYSKSKEINNKLKQDIKSLNDEYNNAVESRADSLYNSYGLFDAVTKEEDKVTGSQLITNLKDQIMAFSDWQTNLDMLSVKGVDSELITELENLGVKSASKINAINNMSSSELSEYVSLWKNKHAQAKDEAMTQLSDLKLETSNKIQELTDQSKVDLTSLRDEWSKQMRLLETSSAGQLTTLNDVYDKKVETLTTDTKTKFVTMSDEIQKLDWVKIGSNIVDGIILGIKSNTVNLYTAITNMALSAVTVMKLALGIHSPSRVFGEIGRYSVLGFSNGLSKFSNLASTEAGNVGNNTVNALRNAISNISTIIGDDININPTIRPVMDLSNVAYGSNRINDLLSNNRTISVSNANAKTSSIAANMSTSTNLQNGSGMFNTLKEILTTNPQPINVTVISQLDGREVARATAPAMSEELAYLNNKNNLSFGRTK